MLEFTERLNMVAAHCNHYGLVPALVCAVIEQESGWNQWKIRYEPDSEKRYVEGLLHEPTEQKARAISWGLMQVMGQTAREQGYNFHLAGLCDPFNGLDMGCRKLRACLDACGGDFHSALQRYNGGGNPDYANQVLKRMSNYT